MVKTAKKKNKKKNKKKPHLFPSNGVIQQAQMGQLRQKSQRIQIRQLDKIIRSQHERFQIRNVICNRRLDAVHPISCQQEGLEPRRQGEVA